MPIRKSGKIVNGQTQYFVKVNYTDIFGAYKSKQVTVCGLAEAKKAEIELRAALSGNTNQTKKFNEIYSEYIGEKAHEVRITSLSTTQKRFENHILPFFDKIKIDKINLHLLKKWKSEINNKSLSIATKQNIYGELRGFLNYCVKFGYIQSNPLIIVGNFKEANFVTSEQKIKVYSYDQFSKYDAAMKDNCTTFRDWCFYVFFNIAFYTGMRKGEINALRWCDIEINVINVRRSVNQKVNGYTETVPKTKSSYRRIQIPSQLIKILSQHLSRQQLDPHYTQDFKVCGGACCLPDTSIDIFNRKMAKLADLPRITIHDFRHTHASLLIAQKINILEISRRLGHANPTMTLNVYAHLFENAEDEVISYLEKLNN